MIENCSPQTEDGYTKIAHELLEAICRYNFSKRQYKLVLALIRKTYGFSKKEDDLTITQLAYMTGLTLAHASETVKELCIINVFLKREGKSGYIIGLVKNYGKWGCSRNRNVPETGTRNGKLDLPETGTTIDNLTKEINPYAQTSFAQFWKAYPKKKSKGQAEKAWAKLKPNEQLVSAILAGIERAKTSAQWSKNAGEYIQHPATWLRARGWEDVDNENESWREEIIYDGSSAA